MYLLVRELTGRRDAAWLAGLLFACLPYRVAQLTHLQVLMAGWMPLALLGLHRYFRTGSRSALAGFVAAYVLHGPVQRLLPVLPRRPRRLIVAGWHLADRRRHARKRRPHDRGDLRAGGRWPSSLALAPVDQRVSARDATTQGFTRTRGEMVIYSATPAAYGSCRRRLARLWKDRAAQSANLRTRAVSWGSPSSLLRRVWGWWPAAADAVRLYAAGRGSSRSC